jgi:DNA-directed RNA polymerase subunit RPC12/RpoP
MAFRPNHSANLPREFCDCGQCGKRGVYKVKGTVWRYPDGRLTGHAPSTRCKYCGQRIWAMTTAEYEQRLNGTG